jgi:hypothetical protein
MRRCELVLFLTGAMTAARGLRAQQKAMSVVGFLSRRRADAIRRLACRNAWA